MAKFLQPNKSVVFLGSSGVGKSTFTNCLLGREVMETGARIIDTPGMRELGMWVVNEGMEQSFSDLYELIQNCRFRDCTHTSEPGCAVKEAIEEETLTKERWKNYMKILKESNFHAAKESKNKEKQLKVSNKKMGKTDKKFSDREGVWENGI